MIGLKWYITVNLALTFILTGVNTPDHGVMFSTLVTTLQDKVSPLVAILKSKDCNSVKNTLSKTLTQLFQNPLLVSLCQLIPPPPLPPKNHLAIFFNYNVFMCKDAYYLNYNHVILLIFCRIFIISNILNLN